MDKWKENLLQPPPPKKGGAKCIKGKENQSFLHNATQW